MHNYSKKEARALRPSRILPRWRELQQATAELKQVAKQIASHWQTIKTWVPVALLLSQYANILTVISVTGLALTAEIAYLKGGGGKTQVAFPPLFQLAVSLVPTIAISINPSLAYDSALALFKGVIDEESKYTTKTALRKHVNL